MSAPIQDMNRKQADAYKEFINATRGLTAYKVAVALQMLGAGDWRGCGKRKIAEAYGEERFGVFRAGGAYSEIRHVNLRKLVALVKANAQKETV